MIPVLFEGQVGGQKRPLVAIGDKAGNFVLLDRKSGQVVHRLALSKQVALDAPPSHEGTETCPNHGGGIEWNGGAYDPNSNSFLVPSTEECAIWKITSDDPQYITAPGALKPDEYAAVMAFLLSYDCVQPAGDGQQPFPTSDLPSLQQVEKGAP
jgi:glucose dehydrogenase